MRILIIHWDFPILLPRVTAALLELGHEVVVSHIARAQAVMDHYDIVFYYHPWKGDIPDQDVRRWGRTSILWAMENPYEYDIIEAIGNTVDTVWDTDRNSANQLGATLKSKVLHVPHSLYPYLYDIGKLTGGITSDVCFLGNAFPRRAELIKHAEPMLRGYDVLLAGSGWDTIAPWAKTFPYLDPIGSLNAIIGTRVCLNIHRQNDVDHANSQIIVPSSPNNRLFDIAGLGKCQLVDSTRCPELHEYYNNSSIMIYFSLDNFVEKLRILLDSDYIRQTLGNNSRLVTQERHLSKIRLSQAIKEST